MAKKATKGAARTADTLDTLDTLDLLSGGQERQEGQECQPCAPSGLTPLLDDLARRAGGWDAATVLATWQPYRSANPIAEDDDDQDAWETPWDAGAPPLISREHRRALGPAPSRRQVLAGYRDPDSNGLVDGQVEGVCELGGDATVAEIADRIAIASGDREFLEVLFADLGARVIEEAPPS